jgi:hypothetical protein
MPDNEQVEENRSVPQSDLDLNLLITDSVWGKKEVPREIKDRLNRFYNTVDEKGEKVVTISSLWGTLGFYTRDMRLGNLAEWNGELEKCRYMIDLASNCLSKNYPGAFLVSLSVAATILETSQSKGGFLRRINNTLRQEHVQQNLDAPKKSFLGGDTKNKGGYQ